MKKSGVLQRVDKELHEIIKREQERMGESYRAASKKIARDIKKLKTTTKKDEITF